MSVQFPKDFRSGVLEVIDGDFYGTDHSVPVFTLRVKGEPFDLNDKAKRIELLEKMAGGEVVEVQMDFRGFQQQDGVPNRNFLKFAKKILRPLAKSFTGVPFLRDHEQNDSTARAGTVTKSRAVTIDGGVAFDMTADVTAPFAVEALLRGNLDRFSIGWLHGGRETILCSLCMKPIFSECSHFPGDKVEDEKTGRQDVIEFVFTEAEGIEVSTINVPAVLGTEIEDVRSLRAQLSFAAQEYEANQPNEDPDMNLKEIAKKLGLPEDSDDKTVLAAIDAREEASSASATAVEELTASNAELATSVKALEDRDTKREFDALFTKYADRLPVERDGDGKRVTSKIETKLRKLEDKGAVEAILDSMPKRAADGSTLQSVPTTLDGPTASPERDERIPAGAQWNGHIAAALEQLEMSVEDYADFGPHNGTPKIKFFNGVHLTNLPSRT